jgi:flagellar motor protein MotB
MPKRRQESGGGVPEWVVTYGDLMSLLLCFFILLAAFSELKQPREFREVLEKIKSGDASWENDVPQSVAEVIKRRHYFDHVPADSGDLVAS